MLTSLAFRCERCEKLGDHLCIPHLEEVLEDAPELVETIEEMLLRWEEWDD